MKCIGLLLCASLALPAASPGTPQSFCLPNGLQIRLMEDHDRPLVRLQFRAIWDPQSPDGRAGFLAKLLATAGAGDLDREAFLRELEENALSLRFQPGPGSFTWSMLATSQTLDQAFQHLAMMVSRPLLVPTAMESLQRRLMEEPGSARNRAESEFLRSLGDPEASECAGLSALQFEDLLRLRRRLLRPERSVLVLQGDLNLDQARQLAALHFGAWGPRIEPMKEDTRPGVSITSSETRFWFADAIADPVEIQVGAPMPPADSRLHLARTLTARLLRRELVAGDISGLRDVTLKAGPEGPWLLRAFPSHDASEALISLQTLLARWRVRVWTEPELALERRLWRSEVLASALHPWELVEGITTQAEGDSLAGLESVNPGEIHAVLLQWLEPSNLRWLVLGGNLDPSKLSGKTGLPVPHRVE